jgi:hypothetical protein
MRVRKRTAYVALTATGFKACGAGGQHIGEHGQKVAHGAALVVNNIRRETIDFDGDKRAERRVYPASALQLIFFPELNS